MTNACDDQSSQVNNIKEFTQHIFLCFSKNLDLASIAKRGKILGETMTFYLERALFVVAPPDSGKSTTLRSMFLDRRLGLNGVPPPSSSHHRIAADYYISNERRLHLRLTSPHEYGESPEEFMEKARGNMPDGRWCFACPFQPDARNKMPDVVDSVKLFIGKFSPERTRVAFLSPNRHGQQIGTFLPGRDLTQELLAIPNVEVMCIDGRQRNKNGLLLADFFDFT